MGLSSLHSFSDIFEETYGDLSVATLPGAPRHMKRLRSDYSTSFTVRSPFRSAPIFFSSHLISSESNLILFFISRGNLLVLLENH